MDGCVLAEEHMDVESVSEKATMQEVVGNVEDQTKVVTQNDENSAMVSIPKSMESWSKHTRRAKGASLQ